MILLTTFNSLLRSLMHLEQKFENIMAKEKELLSSLSISPLKKCFLVFLDVVSLICLRIVASWKGGKRLRLPEPKAQGDLFCSLSIRL